MKKDITEEKLEFNVDLNIEISPEKEKVN